MADHVEPRAAGDTLRCVVVTPETTLLDEAADFVALPLYDGEIGIAPAHTPLIGRLGYGEMRLKVGGETRRYYVDGGFVQVTGNLVSVLTSRAIASSSLDAAAADVALKTAQGRASNTPELMAIRDRMTNQARAQLRAAQRSR
jgi:F-type H+-transporting ATPase subunit epsilon